LNKSNEITIVKGSARYAGAPDIDSKISVELNSTLKEMTEYDRNLLVDLENLFDRERQECDTFVPTCKFTFIFENSYSGLTGPKTGPYDPINRNLYYVNPLYYRLLQNDQQDPSNEIAWGGFPQYYEFDFIRTDSNVVGYTQPLVGQTPQYHILFDAKEQSYYNWFFHLSYPSEKYFNQSMEYQFEDGEIFTWTVSQGIPFVISNDKFNGQPVIIFKCAMDHGLSVGESVELSLNCDGVNIFDVYRLGDGYTNSETNVFMIFNIGFLCDIFFDGQKGTLKRITNKENLNESKSEYYVRRHKIITNYTDAILTNTAFENNAFRKTTKFETKSLTPNLSARTSLKEGTQSYSLSFKNTFSIDGLKDNLNRPLTELYVTSVNRGRFGFFNPLKKGWGFNLGPELNTWWGNPNNETNITQTSFNRPGPFITDSFGNPAGTLITFYYNNPLEVDDLIDGDLCEWNDTTQEEQVLSLHYHKITFNPKVFDVKPNSSLGYYYNTYYKFQLRIFSSYIENVDRDVLVYNLPSYSYYSAYNQKFFWRDIYTYGYIDVDGVGVDNPFLNNKHYLFEDFIFRLIPEGSSINENSTLVNDPLIDDCE